MDVVIQKEQADMRLKIENLIFSYTSTPVLNGIEAHLDCGECVAILGTNGAGKTTMLKCINRLLNYKVGEVQIDNADVRNMKGTQLAKAVGYVPQILNFADTTVFDAVLMGRKPYIKWGATDADFKIVDGLLKKLGLSAQAVKNVNELSGGERQKVAIARALAQQPKLLLFDEPTSNLDLKNQIEVVNLIKEVAKQKNIMIIATMHDINLALRLADKFILLKDGVVFAVGDSSVISQENVEGVYQTPVEVAEISARKVVIPI